MLPKDQNPYYDSARDKPDRSEFASLSMPMQERRPARVSRAWVSITLGVVVFIVIVVIAKRLLA